MPKRQLDHKFTQHRTYTGPGCALCGQSARMHEPESDAEKFNREMVVACIPVLILKRGPAARTNYRTTLEDILEATTVNVGREREGKEWLVYPVESTWSNLTHTRE